ncbi:MAG: hypothetical protein LBK99_20475 [Opitutaceae bacterium]|jgi:hypothetical protein|nr:hypothetical protein [Opitutaceae bacterium]
MKTNYKILSAPLALLALVVFSVPASPLSAADTPVNLVQWTFNSTVDGYTSATGVTITNLAKYPMGGSLNLNGINNFARSGNALRVTTSAYAQNSGTFSLATALARNNYFEFTLTAGEGYEFTLDSLSFKSRAGSTIASTTRGFWIFSSIGGVDADHLLASAYVSADSTGTATEGSTITDTFQTFTVSSLAGTTISSGNSVTFYLYVQTSGSAVYLNFDDLVVTGTVTAIPAPAVPEPASIALIAGFSVLLASLHLRRRRSRRSRRA